MTPTPEAGKELLVWWHAEAATKDTVVDAVAHVTAGQRSDVRRAATLDEAVTAAMDAVTAGRPVTLLIAPDTGFDAAALRGLARAAPQAACVLVPTASDESRLRQGLRFLAPHGGRWAIEAADAGLGARLVLALERFHQPGRLRTTLDRINVQMVRPGAADPVEQRRLVASDLFYRSLLANASDAIVSVDDRGRIQAWNRGAAKLFELDERDVLGRPFPDLFDDVPGVKSSLERAAEGGTVKDEFTIRAGDACRILETTIDGVRDSRAHRIGVIAILRDVTAQRATERELANSAEQKDQFLAMLAHELRNPLSPIRNAAEMLRRIGSPDERVARIADIVSRQVKHMTGLVDDLLDVARVTRGAVVLDRRVVDMDATIAEAVEQANSLIDAKRQVLTLDVAPGLFGFVDRERVVQVLSNLLHNAAKYSAEGAPILLRASAEGDDVRLDVVDQGMGIPAELLPQVFQLFTQGQQGTDRTQGGLGIGLALVKELVERHGGKVFASSPGPAKGSTFTVRLPRADAPGPPMAAVSEGEPPQAAHALSLMVVDDNADAADSLGDLLAAFGYRVDVAHDPLSALSRASAVDPDVYILDIGMPGMDGYELARRLRATPRGRKAVLIALTGYGQPADRLRSMQAGFDHHLVKPLDADLLTGVLTSVQPRH